MNEFPPAVSAIIQEEALLHAADPGQAARAALERIRHLPGYGDLVANLLLRAVRDLVYAFRHERNQEMRAESDGHSRPCVDYHGSKEINKLVAFGYDYFIAGKTLGMLRGEQLAEVAETEEARAHGHLLNVRLLRALVPLVSAKQRVCDAVPEKKLQALWRKVQKERPTLV